MEIINDFDENKVEEDFSYLLSCIKKLDGLKKEIDKNYINILENLSKYYINKYPNVILPHKTFSEAINYYIYPKNLDFKMVTYSKNFELERKDSIEGWTESESILVKKEILKEIGLL